MVLQPVGLLAFLVFHALARGLHEAGERHEDGFGIRIEVYGSRAENHAAEGDGDAERKLADVFAKGSRHGAEEPAERPAQPAKTGDRVVACVDSGVTARHERFQIFAGARLGGESGEAREIGSAALIEVMKALDLREGHLHACIVIEAGERFFELAPQRALGIDEARERSRNHSSSPLFDVEVLAGKLHGEARRDSR